MKSQSKGCTVQSPGPVNHKLIYVKQEKKLCTKQSISHLLSASKELQLTSSPCAVCTQMCMHAVCQHTTGPDPTEFDQI